MGRRFEGAWDCQQRFYETSQGDTMRLLQGHQGSVRSVAYSPDGRFLASGGKDRRVHLWDTASGEPRQVFRGKSGFVPVVLFSPDSRTLAWGNSDSAYLYDLGSEQLRGPLPEHFNVVTSLSFSPDGRYLVACSQQWVGTNHAGMVRSWKVQDGTEETGWRERMPARLRFWESLPNRWMGSSAPPPVLLPAWSVGFAPDGSAMAIGTAELGVSLLKWPGLEEQTALRQSGARGIAFRHDGTMLATVTESKLALLWALTGKKPKKMTLRGHTDRVKCASFSPDGRWLATGGVDGLVIFWDVATGQERTRFDWQIEDVYSLAFAPDGMAMAVAGDKGIVLCDVDIA
jgi:WD40 repeat protein